MKDIFKDRVNEREISQILSLIATPSDKRDHPVSEDIKGKFGHWFDGGAIQMAAGSCTYHFFDGTRAFVVSPVPVLDLTIHFPNGRTIEIKQNKNERAI